MLRRSPWTALLAAVFVIALVFQTSASQAVAGPDKKRILYLGDSMSMGAFGKTMDQEMRDAGHEVFTFVAGGATPYYWLSRYSTIKGPIGYWEKTPSDEKRQGTTRGVPKIEKLLEKFDPDVVVVQTGTNLYATLRSKRRSKKNNVKEVEGLLNYMIEAATQGGRRCYWITPPSAHPDRYPVELQAELADLTKRVVGRNARVFDSRSVTRYTDPYPKNDGIHYGATEAKRWAQVVSKDFNQFMDKQVLSRKLLASLSSKPPAMPETMVASAPRAKSVSAKIEKKELPASTRISTTRKPLPESVRIKSKPPVKKKPVPEVKLAEVMPPVKPKPKLKPQPRPTPKPQPAVASKPPKKRPPVQFVKKAIPVEKKGIQWGELSIEVELIKKSKLKSLKDIDYSYCFAMNEYKVLKVNSGYYPYPTIRIARVVMWSKKLIPRAIDEKVGYRPTGGWELVPMSKYPRFEQMQLVDELPINFDLPIYMIGFE